MKCLREVNGEETIYYEYDGRYVARQIIVGPQYLLLWIPPECSEIPIDEYLTNPPDGELTADEFDRLWQYYSSLPHGTRRIDHPAVKQLLRENGLL